MTIASSQDGATRPPGENRHTGVFRPACEGAPLLIFAGILSPGH
jgi:hypothetical protein